MVFIIPSSFFNVVFVSLDRRKERKVPKKFFTRGFFVDPCIPERNAGPTGSNPLVYDQRRPGFSMGRAGQEGSIYKASDIR
jgi:hypothetical protein